MSRQCVGKGLGLVSRKRLARMAVCSALTIAGGSAWASPTVVEAQLPAGEARESRADDLSLAPKFAQPSAPGARETAKQPKLLADNAPPRRISADAGVTFATDYISRGLQLENQGLIAQPYGNLYFTVYDGGDTVSKVTVFGGIWSSLHTEHTGASPTSFVESWFEFDWDIGFAVDIGKFNLNVMYIEFLSPNDAFGTARNLQLKLSYNDSDSKFPLAPYGIVFFELDGKAGTGSDEGVYVELGVAPGIPLGNKDDGMKLTFPIYLGLGFSDFYNDADGDDQIFGYVAGGVVFSTPIHFLNNAGYGSWTFSVGGYLYYFGDGVRDFNEGIGTDTDWDCVGSMSIGVAF